ncbi:hypothetical protein J2W21_000316 [Sinomonas atrocyanea]|uniref:hypothetical protein n=1 Tax=Sinomonas atrocyanea TaxID=37927 RepID=UPI0027866ABD|nr:hypothetical protein [Sinomonas atrocyanea]MDP9882837.1 hypothetical protein [Sinomonas atrocyanea]
MEFNKVEDWGSLPGSLVHIRFQNMTVCAGVVDCVTNDGRILWIHPHSDVRRLVEKQHGFEAWEQVEGPRGPLLSR